VPSFRRLTALAACLGAGLLLPACSGSTPTPVATAAPTQRAPSGATAAPPATPSATAKATARAGLATCPATPAAATALPVLYRGGSPDDLAVAADGALWVSDASSRVVRLVDGAVTRSITGLADPEGMVPLPGGDVVVAEQGRQRVIDVHPDGSRTTLLTLPAAPPNLLGLDGIAWDPATNAILVPDSPHGTLTSVPLDDPARTTTLATGLPRVVGVEPDPQGGGLWLAAEAEAPNGLLRLTGGHATPLGNLVQLDDAVLDAGLLYVTDLRHGSVHAVDPAGGADRTVATGFGEPQGLAVLPGGGLAVADSKRGVVQRITPCGP
jgi:DNA-binding beta-propeller fold protein YncE